MDLLRVRERRRRPATAGKQGRVSHPQGGRGREGRGAQRHAVRDLGAARASDRAGVPRGRVAAHPAAADGGGEHLPVIRPVRPAARCALHRRHPAAAAHADGPQRHVSQAARPGPAEAGPAGPPAPGGGGQARRPARKKGSSWQTIADSVADAFANEAGITRHAVSALHRRRHQPTSRRSTPAGLKPRTVRYVHTILHAAFKDAMRWNRVARNVANAATPPPIGSVRLGRPDA